MSLKNEITAYAMDFASYLVEKIEGVKQIVLYGSAAKGDFDKESDIDLFIDTDEKIDKKVEKAINDYYGTEKFRKWKLKGMEHSFSCISGKLDSEAWKDLKRSIMNTGIILYGKYKAEPEKINSYILASFENIKPDKKRVLVFRKLFGFKANGKKYPGMIEKIRGVRVGKGSLLIPIESWNEVKDYLHEKKISVKIYDLWSDAKFAYAKGH